jgi:hypothetical protein
LPKALELNDAALTAPPVPRAAQSARYSPEPKAKESSKPQPKADQMPLQVRLPRKEIKAIKIAAAESEQTISEFMLACFHAYMQSREHA